MTSCSRYFFLIFSILSIMVFGIHLHNHHQSPNPHQQVPFQAPPPGQQQQQQYNPPTVPVAPPHAPSSYQGDSGYKSVLYFCNWSIYGRKHFPKDLPATHISHLLYAFANVVPETGEVVLSDKWSDTDIVLDGDSWNDPQSYLKGCLNQLFKIKKQNRQFKVLLSIGGWTYSSNVANGASTPERRHKFAISALQLLKEYGFDGLDVDWEYPKNEQEAQNYVDLLREIRLELDSYALQIGLPRDKFLLSIAAPAGQENVQVLKIREMDPYLSFWNIMCYDFAGSWSDRAKYHSNLFNNTQNTSPNDLAADNVLRYYQSSGVAPCKLVVGMPIYGRAFANTDGLGKPYNGIGEGSWESGVWDYKALPLPNSEETVDENSVAVSCYNCTSKVLVTYENHKTAQIKADYIQRNGLGGGMWWESSGDFPVSDERSIVGTFVKSMGLNKLDTTQNCLYYPQSSHENIRNGEK